ncbi:oxygen-insensitive NADPH nitroreductase [Scopulibacillus darangshiensis]|uniref:oxygen-insensitive NADPH nitroreductase n=1 Tax=Scopulibacillus darangshiensis TaxID=442528 RepID=UPI001A9D9659|nr:oxygen-insensitive NADPH nitroreductase [Scopulibacillus darangshiensis]
MNQTIQTIMAHRSIRKFKDQALSAVQIETLVKSAQAAATSSYLQTYSIIGVTDLDKKKQLSEVGRNQTCIVENGHLFVFCADLYRHHFIGGLENADIKTSLESTETFMVSLIDTALAAENLVIAAESMDLGICYIGGLRNDARKVSEILGLPDRVIPLFGLCVGLPDEKPEQKPRLPWTHVYHENTYEPDREAYRDDLDEYNRLIANYYDKRTNGERSEGWTEQIAHALSHPHRTYMKDFLKEKGFPLK